MPFLTDIDSRAKIKGSRDPLGFVPLWSSFGRQVVGNLTTVSNSVRGFTTLLLGYYFAHEIKNQIEGADVTILPAFLKFEQLVAYSRYSVGRDEDFRGVERVKRTIAAQESIVLSIDPDRQILADQKVYGLWGLYSVPAGESGLINRDSLRLTDEARAFVEDTYITALNKKGFRDGRSIIALLKTQEAVIRINGEHRGLAAVLAHFHETEFSDGEREFYRKHLVLNKTHDKTEGRQEQLAELLALLPQNGDFGMSELKHIIHAAKRRGVTWETLVERLERIRDIECLLVPCSTAFAFILSCHDRAIEQLGSDMKKAWGGSLTTVEPSAIESMKDHISNAFGNVEPADYLIKIAYALYSGEYVEVIKLLLLHNDYVMEQRGAAAWVVLNGEKIAVRLNEESGDLTNKDQLRTPWQNSYFINSLYRVQTTLEARRGH